VCAEAAAARTSLSRIGSRRGVQQGVNQQFIIPKKYVAHKNVPAEGIDLVPRAAMRPVSSGHIPPLEICDCSTTHAPFPTHTHTHTLTLHCTQAKCEINVGRAIYRHLMPGLCTRL
jgi:hypothetical protein